MQRGVKQDRMWKRTKRKRPPDRACLVQSENGAHRPGGRKKTAGPDPRVAERVKGSARVETRRQKLSVADGLRHLRQLLWDLVLVGQ
jgi:hypothetical protein